jgi:hypothetical protein
MGGAFPLAHRDIAAWRDLVGVQLEPWELRLLFAIDDAWLNAQPRPAKKKA